MARYADVERKMAQIHEQLNSLSRAGTTDQQLLLSKIDSFKETIDDVSARVNSLEKAFKETLPALIESVNLHPEPCNRAHPPSEALSSWSSSILGHHLVFHKADNASSEDQLPPYTHDS